ncbi:MAG TPA: radical SAM protein [Candidatus Woesebacteria bacterium]|nr:radical SAM protein [Candidatus Woesebacteria bacterium]
MNLNSSLKSKTGKAFWDLISNVSPQVAKNLAKRPLARKTILGLMEKNLRRTTLENPNYPYQVQADKFYMGRALLKSLDKVLTQINRHPTYNRSLYNSVLPKGLHAWQTGKEKIEAFKDKYGFCPPGFLTVSPGKLCNLKCTGCYANSSSAACEKLDWETVDRIITEKSQDWASWFTVVSGGEPLLWQSQGKTIIDLAKNHQDNFFLIFTNGTLIDKKMARKLAETGNITLAISVEGFAKETDERRGQGTHKRILKAMKNLRDEGIPFGISLTATRKNAELITSEKLIKYYWDRGASYAWIFQLMPIGRGSMDLVVTPEQRLKMFRRTQKLIRKGYFIADFWNCGAVVSGCISAGRPTGGGYLYLEWNGNITPCVFNPYAVGNINEIYKKGGSLNDVLSSNFFTKIRQWQRDYGLGKKPEEIGNWILPCPIRDHYREMKQFIKETKPKPIDEAADQALKDKEYEKKMIEYDRELAKILNPVWEKEYLKKRRDNCRH